MLRRLLNVWLPRLLFLASVGLALALAGGVLLAPWFVTDQSAPLVRLFAHDDTVRRTALVSAGGLLVTAFVFFRLRDPDANRKRREPPRTMAGA